MGEPIRLYAAFNERDEADFVVNRIRDHITRGNLRNEVAVLYRSNAQSRVFEENLLAAGIPYRVYGGLRFFERAEIKDALAYLRLISNRDDDPSFERVVNTPTRGVGQRTMEAVRMCSRQSGMSLWRAAQAVITEDEIPKRSSKALYKFLSLVDRLDSETGDSRSTIRLEWLSRLVALFHTIGEMVGPVVKRESRTLRNLLVQRRMSFKMKLQICPRWPSFFLMRC